MHLIRHIFIYKIWTKEYNDKDKGNTVHKGLGHAIINHIHDKIIFIFVIY